MPIGRLSLLIDQAYPLQQLCNQLNALSKTFGLLFIEQQAGAGFLQWSLSGDEWVSFAGIDDASKPYLAKVYAERCAALKETLKDFPLTDAVLTVPSQNDFVFFRKSGNEWEVALAAWGYRFADILSGEEIGTWIEQKEYQNVSIGFSWNESILPNMPFRLDEMPRTTSDDGYFHVDKPLEVGRSFNLTAFGERQFRLVVEKGKSEYVYDITQWVNVEIKVTKDGVALTGQSCELSFNSDSWQLSTDETGIAKHRMPLVGNIENGALMPQPVCTVICGDASQQQNPMFDGQTLRFAFDFQSKITDETNPPVPEPEPGPEPEPEPEPKYVKIRLLDYGGYALPDLPFKLITKKKGEVLLQTDGKGYCQVPQEWFSHKEKMRIKFVISPEYQEKHDLHEKK